jgi:mannosyltransferase OCH1-like enzyme
MQGWDKVPSKFDANRTELRRLNPEWRIMEWDEASLRSECAALGPEFLRTFDELPLLISKVDFGRYVVLYRHGGISLDLDMAPLKPLSTTPGLDTHAIMLSKSSIPPFANNAVFIACPMNPFFMKLLLDIMNTRYTVDHFPSKELYVHVVTGPILVSRMLISTNDIHMLDAIYFEPCLPVDKTCVAEPSSIMLHRHELSWMSDWMIMLFRGLLWTLHHWYVFALIAVLIFIVTKTELKRGLRILW